MGTLFVQYKCIANMNDNIIRGPKNVPLLLKPIGNVIYENLQRESDEKILLKFNDARKRFNIPWTFSDSEVKVDRETNRYYNTKEIQQKCVKLAIALKKAGIKQQDVISIVGENSINFAFGIIATHYIGAIVNPVNPAFTARELQHAFGVFKPKLVLCMRKVLEKVLGVTKEMSFIQKVISMDEQSEQVSNVDTLIKNELYHDIDDFAPDEIESLDQTAILLLTSGTTSLPKGVKVTYKSIAYHLTYMPLAGYFNLSPDVVTILCLPLCHIFSILLFTTALSHSIKMIVMPKFEPSSFLKTIENHKVTELYIVPPIIEFLSSSTLANNFDLSSLKVIATGGAPVSTKVVATVKERLNIVVRVGYGMTECGLTNLCVNSTKECCVGFLVPYMEAKIIDSATNVPLGPNKMGEICFKGPTVITNYYDGPCDTIDREGFLHTGDVGHYDDNGNLYVTDRIKDIIKYKGYQVSSLELESILSKHPAVIESAVIGVPDKRAGEFPLAAVVKHQDINVTEKELTDFVAGQVADYKFLRGGVKFIAALPRNANGKVLKRVIREWALSYYHSYLISQL